MTVYRSTPSGWVEQRPLRGSWLVRLEMWLRRAIRHARRS